MFRVTSRVLIASLVLVLSLSTVVVVQAAPDLDRAGEVTVESAEPAPGVLGWFESLIERMLEVVGLSGSSCDPEQDQQCTQGEGGGTIDVNG